MGVARAGGAGGVRSGEVDPGRSRRATRASAPLEDAPPTGSAESEAVSATEPEEEENEEDVVKSRGITWGMWVPTSSGVLSSRGVSTDGSAGKDYRPHSAEAAYLQQERVEREEIELSSAQAKNVDDVLWLSDTTTSKLADNFEARVKAFADGASELSLRGGGKRKFKSFRDVKEDTAAKQRR